MPSDWKIKPTGYIDDELAIQHWDDILRLIATIKLKEVTASDLFRRLNSYSKQHALYHALKAFGQIPKSLCILRLIDDPALAVIPVHQLDSAAARAYCISATEARFDLIPSSSSKGERRSL